jgi:hypothetical protein
MGRREELLVSALPRRSGSRVCRSDREGIGDGGTSTESAIRRLPANYLLCRPFRHLSPARTALMP